MQLKKFIQEENPAQLAGRCSMQKAEPQQVEDHFPSENKEDCIMKKKRLLSALLVAAMTVSLTACGGDDGAVTNNANDANAAPATETVEEGTEVAATSERPETPMGQLIIGSVTDMEGDFYDPDFNNNATNYKAYDLIHGYNTVTYTKEGMFELDPTVVANCDATDNEDGTKTYTITLNDGLLWSDGSPVTAKDYVFATLLESSPEMMGVDNYSATAYTQIDGWDDYNSGATENLKGMHLIDDKTFSITVAADELPFHYDIYYAGVMPRPLAVIAPECDVVDSEDGASISGDFTTELLLETINNTDTGYRYNPQVTCGPYKLESYDAASRQATYVVNDKFAGDYRGVKPAIEKVIIKTVSADTQINELKAGTVDLLFQISGGTDIEAGLDLVDEGVAQKHTFFRNGYGKIQFDCSQFPTDSKSVRQAIAYCLDRNEFARQYSGGYATIVHSAYGLAQWEYSESKDWIDQNLNTYDKNIETAKEILAADGWNLNESGEEYKDGDGTRYKEVDGELKPLVIEWCNTEGNPVSELLATMLPEAMEEAGMELKATSVDFPTLSAAIDHQGDKIYNMYNLGSGFATAYSPWYYYSKDEQYMGAGYNSNWILNDDLAGVTATMRNIPYDDKETWLENWQQFVLTWNEELPDIPLYSDEYHDFYSNKLQGWDTTSIWEWSSAIIDAWVTE